MAHNRLKHHRRYQEIINTFIKNGLSHVLYRIGLTDKSNSKKDDDEKLDGNLTNIGEKLRNSLQSLGPTFIKLGQIASSRRDLVPEQIAVELEKLQDDVQAFEYETVQEIIERELGDKPEEIFAEFNNEPLATASIGQVHVARLRTGEEVAIKIQRPDIESIIKTDLEILHDLARILTKRMEWARTYRIKETIEEFSHSLRNELNYNLEGRNGERIAEQFQEDSTIHIPEIFWEFTTEKVLTMEMIHGIKVNQYDELNEKGYDLQLIAQRISDAMMHQILEVGVFHGDPHAGNIFILPGNEIAFLDFGMIGYLNKDVKYYFSSLIIHLQSGDTDGIINIFEEWELLDDVENMSSLRRDIDTLQSKYYETSLQKISLGKIMLEVFSIAYEHKIKIPTDIAILTKVVLTLEMILENLDPKLSIMKAVEPYGKKLILERYHPMNMAQKSWMKLIENIKILSDLPKDLKAIASAAKKGKLQFDINVFHLDDVLKKLDQVTNRISFSIILLAFSILMVGLIIGASIVGQTTLLWRIPVIEIGSIVATLMFLFMVFTIIRSGRM